MDDKEIKDVQVFGDVLILPDSRPEKTESGLFLSKSQFAESINSGSVIQSKLEAVPIGSRIIHLPYAYSELKVGGEVYRVVNEESIIAVVK